MGYLSSFHSWAMVLKLSKKVHLLQIYADLSKKSKSIKAIYICIYIWKVSLCTFKKWYCLLLLCYFFWVNIFLHILFANISWTVAQTTNHIIFKSVIRTFRCICISYFDRLSFLAEVSMKLQKVHYFGQFNDHSSVRKHRN